MDRVPGFEPGGWRFEPSSVRAFIIMQPETSKVSLLRHTSQSYAAAIFQALGKGRQHAEFIYQSICRQGRSPQNHPAFKNCPLLLENILNLTDFTPLPLAWHQSDGHTAKFLLKTHDQLEIESVLIPMQSGGTLCISSQVGCRMGCAFCETGRMGLLRNLTVEEIVSQVFVARHVLGFSFRNVVFMGMGEPFDNYEAVLAAARVLMDPKGFKFGRKNITISTSGCVDQIYRFAEEGPDAPNLAVSVNAPNNEIRNRLMPINKKFDMARLYEAMQFYGQKTGRQILAAYVLMKEINDSLEHAELLAQFLQGLDVKINLIPYNPQSKDRFQPPELIVLESFASFLRSRGYYTLLRVTKGRSIMAACGQLGNLELRKKLAASLKEQANFPPLR
jgi:23S rRNA (adenine2503-C2)-methyltransferase